jgi:hypothetical protein
MIHEVWRSGLVRYHGYEWPPASTDVSAVLFLAVGGSVYDWHGMEWNGMEWTGIGFWYRAIWACVCSVLIVGNAKQKLLSSIVPFWSMVMCLSFPRLSAGLVCRKLSAG